MIRKLLIILAIIFGGIALGSFVTVRVLNAQHDRFIDQLEVVTLDLSMIDDGEYEGSYTSFHVTIEVLVTVQNHIITSIEYLQEPDFENEYVNDTFDLIILNQSFDIDLVAGATLSSAVALKAVENALYPS